MTTPAYINREMLRWAINRAAPFIDTAREEQWLEGEKLPTIRQAQAIARRLAIPFGYLYLSEHPNDELPIPDLRTRQNAAIPAPSLDLREQLDWVAAKQQWFAELRRREGGAPLPFVGSVAATQAINHVANEIDGVLNLTDIRIASSSWSDYVTRLARGAEIAGILVLRSGVVAMNNKRRLNPDEFQGFAIADPMAPLIFINTNDYVTATIFTFAHELAHIWLGESGVTLSDEEGPSDDINVEQFCNRVAAELLVPADQFDTEWRPEPLDIQTNRLARTFRVSSIVILRRALDMDRITRPEFFQQVEVERRKRIPRVRGNGGSGINNILARNGQLLAAAAVSGALEGRVGFSEAAEVLGVKVQTVKNLAEVMKLR
jgi:Zn-dependent peptidase ImmA (M78 family)